MITSYNLEDYIDKAISSVVSQNMPCDWELLIGDDGSTDGTVSKIKKWQEKYPNNIRYFVNERTQTIEKDGYRAGKNRASLLEKAIGDYLIFLDGDDCWLGTDKLVRQFEILEAPENADCSCCAHNIQACVVPEDRKYSWLDEKIPSQKLSLKQYWSYYYFHTNTLLFRKECKELLLNPLYKIHLNDNMITYIVLQYGNVYYVNKVWARYNLTGNGLWTGHNRVYGMFRNITLFDLERKICPSLEYNILKLHYGNILYLLRHYHAKDYSTILPILKPLDPSVFKTTLFLAKIDNITLLDKIKRTVLFVKMVFIYLIVHVNNAVK